MTLESKRKPLSRPRFACVAAIAALTLIGTAHFRALHSQALCFDDREYLVDNGLVQRPSLDSVRRFFAEILQPSTVTGYYQPLTMLSLMADYAVCRQVDDLRPYHRTSLALHLLNCLLVFALLMRLFDDPLAAGLATAIYGSHPLTVDSVVWLAERKTLLATLFALGALHGHVSWARSGKWRYLGGVTAFQGLSLLSKPTTTMLPLLLLCLDNWPLRRWRWRVVVEKIPLFVLAAAAGVITFVSQGRTGGVTAPTSQSLGDRLGMVIPAIGFYIEKLVWPFNLSSFYDIRSTWSMAAVRPWVAIGAAVLIVLILARQRFGFSGALVGIAFFLIAIMPTMGVIGFTHVVVANRYAYFPLLGLILAVGAGLAGRMPAKQPAPARRLQRTALSAAAIGFVLMEIFASRSYLSKWSDTETLRRHMVAMAPGHAIPRFALGEYFSAVNRTADAVAEYELALELDPDLVAAHVNMSAMMLEEFRLEDAEVYIQQALRRAPDDLGAMNNLGLVRAAQGRISDAIAIYEKALKRHPNSHVVHTSFGMALAGLGRFEDALEHYRVALQENPRYAAAHDGKGVSLGALGRYSDALHCFETALRIQPTNELARRHLAMTHAALQGR